MADEIQNVAAPAAAPEADVARASELLDGARRPLLWVGGGALAPGAGRNG